MKIAFLDAANSPYTNARIKYLVSRGHQVYYFGLPGMGRQTDPEGVTCIDIGPSPLRKVKYLRLFGNVYTIRRLSQKYKLDVLHIIGLGNCIHVPFSGRTKVVIEHIGSDVLVGPDTKYPKITRGLYKIAYRMASAVVQDSVIAQEAGIRLGAPQSNNMVIEIGVDFSLFNSSVKAGVARRRLGIAGDQKLVFSSRGFAKVYNIDTIIRSIPLVKRKFSTVKYVFCSLYRGLEEQCRQLANELHVQENTIFVGTLDNTEDLALFLRDADVVVSVPSSDSSPLSVYEAMACGTPVIISELPWYQGKFVKDRHLLAVGARNVEALAGSISDILEGRKTLDLEDAYRRVFEFINMETENSKLEGLYRRILHE